MNRTMSLSVLAAAFASGAVSAATIKVPLHQPTIQAAINVAVDDDIVLVSPGTYGEAIDFLGKEIIVISSDGPETTIINAAGQNASAVSFENDETATSLLEGFTVTGGTGNGIGVDDGGGGLFMDFAHPTIVGCIIEGNNADLGGGMYARSSLPELVNCIFRNNNADDGGAIYANTSNPFITNCNIIDNTATTGGGIYSSSAQSNPRLINCIVWDNTPNSFGGSGNEIISYSNTDPIEGGVGNISATPLFVSGSDFQLQAGSPCIDAGDSTAVADEVFKDIANQPRGADDPDTTDSGVPVFGLTVDMGVYEFQTVCDGGGGNDCPQDLSGDGVIGFTDLVEILSFWGFVCP